MKWHMQAHNLTTNPKVEIYSTLPDSRMKKM